MKQFCKNCGNSEVVKGRNKYGYYYCPVCYAVYEEFDGELVKIDVGVECKYGQNVLCNPLDRLDDECCSCGWNPEVRKERLMKIREQRQEMLRQSK